MWDSSDMVHFEKFPTECEMDQIMKNASNGQEIPSSLNAHGGKLLLTMFLSRERNACVEESASSRSARTSLPLLQTLGHTITQ